jgi:diaminopimelate decarboxylase
MSNFNAIPRPATVLVTGDQASVIRRRETEEEVFSRDVLPQHLERRQPEILSAERLSI